MDASPWKNFILMQLKRNASPSALVLQVDLFHLRGKVKIYEIGTVYKSILKNLSVSTFHHE